MRVTNNMMVDQLRRNLLLTQQSMYTKQDQLATGKRIQRASDDPILSSKVLKYSSDISALSQYERNTTDALSWLEITESAVYDNVKLLQRARELTVQAANGTNTPSDTKKMSLEMEGLMKQLISNGNMNFAGRYIFSGFETNKPLFKEDGSFNIDISQQTIDKPPVTEYEVGIGENMNISSNGLDLYGYNLITDTFTNKVPVGVVKGGAATQSVLNGTFALNQNYSADNLNVVRDDGVNPPVTFTVNSALMNGTIYPLTKETVLNAYRNADDGLGNKLSSVADIYYDASDKLVIKNKAYGAITLTTAAVNFTPTATTGVNTVEAVVSTPTTITDAEVLAGTNDFLNKEMVITINGNRQKITLFTTPPPPTTVANVITEMNAKFDLAFGPGNVVATGVSGGAISIATGNSPQNGQVPTLSVETIRATQSSLINDMKVVYGAMLIGDQATISSFLGKIDGHLNNVLAIQTDIGARVNRMELVVNRIAENTVTYTRQLSDAQDADISEVIMTLKNSENVYKSALSVGARVIQPTLLDFLR